jgi:major membrane immunogen (membrane-anchored lipoprotein)
MKKTTSFILLTLMSIIILVGCNAINQNTTSADDRIMFNGNPLADGIYFAMEDDYGNSGWKYTVTIEIKDGKITSVDWNAAHKQGGKDKKTSSIDGEYGMVAYGNAISEWHEQALAVEQFVLEKQSIDAIVLLENGKTDAISGATITVSVFVELANAAFEQGPVGSGLYQDGAFFAQASEASSSGWVDQVSLTVINGRIVSAYWTATHADYEKDKRTLSEEGEYLMSSAGAVLEWHEQAENVEEFLISEQSTSLIQTSEDGKTDVISGATMVVEPFVELVESVLILR